MAIDFKQQVGELNRSDGIEHRLNHTPCPFGLWFLRNARQLNGIRLDIQLTGTDGLVEGYQSGLQLCFELIEKFLR